MRVILREHTCEVIREEGDPKIHGGPVNAAGESRLLYKVKQFLNSPEGGGFDFIKKRMWRDGHLVDEMQQYLRGRKPVKGRVLCVYNGGWMIEGADERYNRTGRVLLRVEDLGKD